MHRPERREAWLADYAKVCAEDYLARVHAEPGRWLISVHRLLDDERRHIVTIRLRWPQAPSADQAVPVAS